MPPTLPTARRMCAGRGRLILATAVVLALLAPVESHAQADSDVLPLGWEIDASNNALTLDLEEELSLQAVTIDWAGAGLAMEVLGASGDGAWVRLAEDAAAGPGAQRYPFDAVALDRLRIVVDDELAVGDAVASVRTERSGALSTLLAEDFDLAVGWLPYGWDARSVSSGPVADQVTVELADGEPAINLRDNSNVGSLDTTRFFEPTDQDVRVSVRMRADQTDATQALQLQNTGTSQIAVTVAFGDDGQLFTNVGGARVDLGAYEPGVWYDVVIDARIADGRFDLTIDGQPAVSGAALRQSVARIDNLRLNTSRASTGSLWFDDIEVAHADRRAGPSFDGPFPDLRLPRIGAIAPRDAADIDGSTFAVGGETLDRDFARFSAYRDFLGPLGAQQIRLQGGWERVEQTPGVYEFEWLDEAVFGAVEQGVEPWLQFSYGNPAYSGGGTGGLRGGIPTSDEALAGWDNWVAAMVERYGDVTTTWEVWNEPDLGGNVPAAAFARFYERTARIVRELQPESNLIAVSLAGNQGYAQTFINELAERQSLDLVDEFGYHIYGAGNPDRPHYSSVENLRGIVNGPEGSEHIGLRQTEAGAPSEIRPFFALAGQPWSETSQAKWNLRRMLGDLGRDIPSNTFQISDMRYDLDDEVRWNLKGLLQVDSDLSIRRPKEAYRAVQHLSAVFDDSLQRVENLSVDVDAAATLSVFGYRHRDGLGDLAVLWRDDVSPVGRNNAKLLADLDFASLAFEDPVYVDLRTGGVHDVPAGIFSGTGTFTDLPYYDSPVVVAERDVITRLLDDPDDGCPDPRSTVVVGNQDTGVPNRVADGTCTINDLILDDQEWPTKGAFLRHVNEVVRQLRADGVIDGREGAQILRVAARSDVGS